MQRAPSSNADGGTIWSNFKILSESTFPPKTVEILAAALDEVSERMRQWAVD